MLVLSFGNGCATNSGNQLAAHSGSATPDTFALADADHDGKLSRGEAGDYLVYVVFAISDKNKDARLTQEEWTRGDPTQANALRLRDPNQDGLVTLEEAIVYGRRGGAGLFVQAIELPGRVARLTECRKRDVRRFSHQHFDTLEDSIGLRCSRREKAAVGR